MRTSLVALAERINGMELDFSQLHKKIVEECGPELIGDRLPIKIPILSRQDTKIRQQALSMNVKAGYIGTQPIIFYNPSAALRDVYLLRYAQNYSSLSTALVKDVTDDKGRNTPPYIEFYNELERIRLGTSNVAHLLATWYAAVDIW